MVGFQQGDVAASFEAQLKGPSTMGFAQLARGRLRRGFSVRLGAAVAAAALLAGPGLVPALAGAQAYAAAQDGFTTRVAHSQEIDTLNPFTAVFLVSTQIGRLMYEYLTVNSAESSSPEPGLAESWTTSADN